MKTNSKCPATRVVMMPRDTNGMGNIFGGVILSHIDLAGAVAAHAMCSNRLVTVCMKEVVFKKPVHVGDLLTCWSEVTRVGRTSITTHVEVEVERNGRIIPVTEATVVYVAVSPSGRPTPVKPLIRKRSGSRDGCCLPKSGAKASRSRSARSK